MFADFVLPQIEDISSFFQSEGVSVKILREDLVHPFISGNKWRKLKYNLQPFIGQPQPPFLITFGGAFSNHLVAFAAACKKFGLNGLAIVRGEKVFNPYLDFVQKCGVQLLFVERSFYRQRNDPDFFNQSVLRLKEAGLLNETSPFAIIPEGGANEAAIKGVKEIGEWIPAETTHVVCPAATGATIAGLSLALKPHQRLEGIAVLKGEAFLQKDFESLGGKNDNTTIHFNYHFNGYAKMDSQLTGLCSEFKNNTGIPVEPIYTGKMIYAVKDLIKKNYFPRSSKLLLVHTGGVFDFNVPLY